MVAVVVVLGVVGMDDEATVVWLGLLLWRGVEKVGGWDLVGELLRFVGWRRLSRLGSLTDCRHERMRSEEGC